MKSLDQSRLRSWNLEPREAATLTAILVATALIYMPSLRNGWVWDDWEQIVQSEVLHSWSGIGKSFIYDSWWFRAPDHLPNSGYYRPLQDTYVALSWMALGNHPAVWHLEKIVLELIAVVLAFRLAQLLTGNTTVALLSAAIFGLIPANVEAVVWAAAVPEPMAAAFEMGALCCLITRDTASRFSRGVVFALMLYAGALLSHESAILFCLIVAAYFFLIERRDAGESFRLALPFMVVAIAYLFARLSALGTSHFLGLPYIEKPSAALGWESSVPPRTPADMILTAPVVLLDYLGVLAVPGFAGPAHNVDWVTTASPITFICAGILVMLAAVVLAFIWRSQDRRIYLFCAAWSLLTIAPAMKLNALALLVQDRVLYAPSFGWSLAIGLTAVRLAAISPRVRVAVAGAMAVVLAAFAVSVVRLEGYWYDNLTFFARCVTLAPYNVDYRRELVEELNQKGDFTTAMNEIRQAVNQEPDNIYLHQKLAEQYGLMQRPEDFQAEILKMQQLRANARAANAASATPPPR